MRTKRWLLQLGLAAAMASWLSSGCNREADDASGRGRAGTPRRRSPPAEPATQPAVPPAAEVVPDLPGMVAALGREADAPSRGVRPHHPLGGYAICAATPRLEAVVERLAAAPGTEVATLLAKVVETGSNDAAAWAAEVLARKGDIAAIKPVWIRYLDRRSSPALRDWLRAVSSRLPRDSTAFFVAQGLASPDFQVRIAACEWLEACPSPGALGDLCKLLDAQGTAERDAAIAAVVKLGAAAVPTLLEAASDPAGSNRRTAAILALGRIPSRAGLAKLLDLCSAEDPFLRRDAADALEAGLRPRDSRGVLRPADDETLRAEQDALEGIVFELASTRYAKSTDERFRERAIELYGMMGLPQAGAAVRRAAETDPSDRVRSCALRAMRMRGDPALRDRAFQALTSHLQRTRDEAASTIARDITDADLPRLRPALAHGLPEVRRAAVRLAARLSSPEARAVLVAATVDGDESVVMTACHGLRDRVFAGADLGWLRRLSASPWRDVRGQAAHMLGKLGTHDAVTLLLGLLQHDDDATRRHAADAFGPCADPRVFEPLYQVAAQRVSDGFARFLPDALFTQAPGRVPELLKTLDATDPARRAVAAKLLEKVADPAAKRRIRELTLAKDRVVACNATCALLDAPDDAVVEALADMMWHSEWGGALAGRLLNCGVPRLSGQSVRWHREHGYTVITVPVAVRR